MARKYLRDLTEEELADDWIEAAKRTGAQHAQYVGQAESMHEHYIGLAAPKLLDFLATAYALSYGLTADALLRKLEKLNAPADKDGKHSNPIRSLVKALYGDAKTKAQITRWTQVIEMLRPTDDERHAIDNDTFGGLARLFRAKFSEHDNSIKAVIASRKPKPTTAATATEAAKQYSVADFLNRAERYSILSTTIPVNTDMVVVLRRVPCGGLEAIPLPGATARLEQLVHAEMAT